MAFALQLDALGDIYLTGRMPVELVTRAAVDRLLGAVAETADESFNVILELGFAESIRRGVGLAALPRRVDREPCRLHPPGPGRESEKLIQRAAPSARSPLGSLP